MRDHTVGNILSDWNDNHPSLFGKHAVNLKHTIHKSKLFTDEALVALLENAPRRNYHVTTMDKRDHSPTYKREGEFGELSGAQILQAVRDGHLWINFQSPQEINSEYGELLGDIYKEFEARVPGLETYKHKMTILISSPKLKVKYHFDVPGQTLWQIRGNKKVFVYPAEPPFLSQEALEKVVLGQAHETDIEYQPWFDDYAKTYEIAPGDMLHWPLNCPHRVENHDNLNVSLTTEHWTKPLRDKYAVNYGNGLLRKIGMNNLSRSTSGAGLYTKAAMAAVAKISGYQRKTEKPFSIDFQVDPKAPDCIRDIEPHHYVK